MKKFALLGIISLFSLNLLAQSDDQAILAEAKSSIGRYLNLIPVGSEKLYGFNNREEFQKVEVKNIYPVYILKAENNFSAPTQSNEYRIAIEVDGNYRALLTVIKEQDHFKAVDFGANVLAMDIQQLLISKSFAGKKMGMLRLYNKKSDYLFEETASAGNISFYPLTSAVYGIGQGEKKISELVTEEFQK